MSKGSAGSAEGEVWEELLRNPDYAKDVVKLRVAQFGRYSHWLSFFFLVSFLGGGGVRGMGWSLKCM